MQTPVSKPVDTFIQRLLASGLLSFDEVRQSLAAWPSDAVTVLARAITLITSGPGVAGTAQEAYGLARVYERAGEHDNAEAALLRTIEFAKRVGAEPEVHGEALRRLAWIRRRARRMHDAAEAWRELAVLPRCAAALRREAKEALAIHHEHRLKDLMTARQHALDLLSEGAGNPTRLQHRLDRLERKLARYTEATLPL